MDLGKLSVQNLKREMIDKLRLLNPTLANDVAEVKLDWYTIKDATTDSQTTEVFIYESIGGWFGVDAETFVRELNDITTPNIDVRINSPGGSVFDSIAIASAMTKHQSHITTYVDSLAASGASIIALAADEVVMMPGSQLMIHDASGIEIGNAKAFREFADFLDNQSQNIASMYSRKAGGTAEDWRALMVAETWMFDEEAVTLGLADRIYERPKADKPAPQPTGDDATVDDGQSTTDDTTDDDGPITDDEIDAFMKKHHKLTNKGFKYAGRNRAPDPKKLADEHTVFVASLIDAMPIGRK